MKRCREVAEAYAIPVLQRDGFEADDLIATAIARGPHKGLKVVCSGDKDLLQLVADDVIVWDARKRVCGRDEVVEKWGVPPERVRDLLALMGDSSDNVPGVDHVGEKTAAKLLGEYGSLDGVYKNVAKVKGKTQEYLRTDEANARLSYSSWAARRRAHGVRPRAPAVRRVEQGQAQAALRGARIQQARRQPRHREGRHRRPPGRPGV
jgi:DNA polymerase-1